MVSNYLKLLAIPAGFEPATIGLEGRLAIHVFCGFASSETVNRDPSIIEKSRLAVNRFRSPIPPATIPYGEMR